MVKLRIVFFLTITIIIITLTVVVCSFMKVPMFVNNTLKMNVGYLIPQGWAFFTRDAREERIFIFKVNSQGEVERLNVPGSSLKYAFGLDRSGKKILSEILPVINSADSTKWISTEVENNFSTIPNVISKLVPIEFENKNIRPLCCGQLIIVKSKPVPWAYSKFPKITIPIKLLRINSTCEDN